MSSSSHSSSYSTADTETYPNDLGLDPSDPLNLLLHNTSQSADSSMEDFSSGDSASPPDWSELTALWQENKYLEQSSVQKQFPDGMDFGDLASLPMDMDFNPSMSIEPSMLHFDPMKLSNPSMNYSYDDQSSYPNLNADLLSANFPFTFHTSLNDGGISISSPATSLDSRHFSEKGRRLSITSSSSSSGPSFSPAPESVPSPSTGYASDSGQQQQDTSHDNVAISTQSNSPAAELANRVRQSAGVMVAVPMRAQLQGHGSNQHLAQPNINTSTTTTQAKLPIPRLPRQLQSQSPSPSVSSSAESTPPPSTPPPSSAPSKLVMNVIAPSTTESSSIPTPTTGMATLSAGSRPKTSHTTIERRYRTNLNARIQSLRMAVPALRVLEDREGNGKKIKKNVKGNIPLKGSGMEAEDGTVDVIDERGFVDGVKVARKCSKANVLGKAVEYIKVLKRRENRLKTEQQGLKALVSGLVGGPALLREWEQEWREQFGGEERDEVEAGADADGDDDDSDEDEGDDGEEEAGKKRKRPKASPPTKEKVEKDKKPVVPNDGSIPEKRKRGRPRKIVPAPSPSTLSPGSQPSTQVTTHMQEQRLYPPAQDWMQPQFQQQQPQPQQYLLAVFAIFTFFNSPFTSSPSPASSYHHSGTVLNSLQPPLAYAPEIVAQFPAPVVAASPVWSWKEYIQLFHFLVSVFVVARFVANWIGIRSGSKGFSLLALFSKDKRNQGKIDWVKEGEKTLLTDNPSSLYARFQIYRAIKSQKSPSVRDLATLAMVVSGADRTLGALARAKAGVIWELAKLPKAGKIPTRAAELLVLDNLDVPEAALRLQLASPQDKTDGERQYSPIEVAACVLVRERTKRHLGQIFVDVVGVDDEEKGQRTKVMNTEIRRTIDAAKELGGSMEYLGKVLERAWIAPSSLSMDDVLVLDKHSVDGEIKSLLMALILYHKIFKPSTSSSGGMLMSPPPSPSRIRRGKQPSEADMAFALRTALGSRIFEDGDTMGGRLEDARDIVVDLVVEYERRGRSPSP